MIPDCAVIVFAKAPVAGQAKTRLIPALGAAGAARLAERLLRHTLAQAVLAGVGPVELCCSPDASHPVLAELALQHRVTIGLQGEGDLGERMSRALSRALQSHPAALLIGTDAPALDAPFLRDASAALRDHDAVFGPALDGGYTLVGLARTVPGLFDAMAWSTPRVMMHTRKRIRMLGLRHAELRTLADIDEPADLIHLPTAWRAGIETATRPPT